MHPKLLKDKTTLLNITFKLPMVPLIVVTCILTCAVEAGLRIFEGRDASPHEYPYVVSFGKFVTIEDDSEEYYSHMCTGSAITPTWTLTAAHCTKSLKRTPKWVLKYVIRYGAITANGSVTESYSDMVRYVLHPNYKRTSLPKQSTKYSNDVALLKSTPIQIARYGKLSSVEYPVLMGQAATAVGYGTMYDGDYIDTAVNLGRSLQVLDVLMKTCDEKHTGRTRSPIICLNIKCSKTMASICPGDSGGPLIHSSGVVGVNHMGSMMACTWDRVLTGYSTNLVGIIVPISPYIEWIRYQIKNEGPLQR